MPDDKPSTLKPPAAKTAAKKEADPKDVITVEKDGERKTYSPEEWAKEGVKLQEDGWQEVKPASEPLRERAERLRVNYDEAAKARAGEGSAPPGISQALPLHGGIGRRKPQLETAEGKAAREEQLAKDKS